MTHRSAGYDAMLAEEVARKVSTLEISQALSYLCSSCVSVAKLANLAQHITAIVSAVTAELAHYSASRLYSSE